MAMTLYTREPEVEKTDAERFAEALDPWPDTVTWSQLSMARLMWSEQLMKNVQQSSIFARLAAKS